MQFVDGDCEIVSGWIETAAAALAADGKTAVVCGRRRERHPEASVYNKLCDLEWDTPVGVAKACGGDAMFRLAALAEVGGYDPAVIAGEEPELCVRLRQRGWVVRRIAGEMTLHDAAMTRVGQWWTRNVRAGHAYAQGYALHGSPPERFRAREVRSIERWAVVPVVVTAACVLGVTVVAPRWAWVGLLPLGLYAVLAGRVALGRYRRGAAAGDAAAYGASVAAGKFPQHLGVRRYRSAARRGRRLGIIEYKGPAGSGGRGRP